MVGLSLLLLFYIRLFSTSLGQVVLQLENGDNKTLIRRIEIDKDQTTARDVYGINCLFNCIVVNNFFNGNNNANNHGNGDGNDNTNNNGNDDDENNKNITTITLPFLRP